MSECYIIWECPETLKNEKTGHKAIGVTNNETTAQHYIKQCEEWQETFQTTLQQAYEEAHAGAITNVEHELGEPLDKTITSTPHLALGGKRMYYYTKEEFIQ